MINIKYAHLHAPLFHAGINCGDKLDPTKRAGLTLVYDRDEKELHVTLGKITTILPHTSVFSMVPEDKGKEKK
jgi:hypothetical protein